LQRGLTLAALARLAGYSAQHVSEVERATAPVSGSFVAAVDRALDARGQLLVLLPAVIYERAVGRHERDAARRRDAPVAVPSTDDSEARDRPAPSRPAGEDEDVKRRTFLGLGLAALLPPMDGVEGAGRGADEAVGPDIDEWERTADAYSYDVVTAHPRDLLPALAADFAELRDLLAGALSNRDRRRLVGVTGQLAALTAGVAVYNGQPQVARRWWRRARQAASATGDTKLRAFTCGRQAVLCLYGGYTPPQVLTITEELRASTTPTACAGTMEALGARAQALAVIGRERDSRDALAEMDGMLERLPSEVTRERVSVLGWSEQELRHAESYVYMHLGDTRRGEQARERALKLYPAETWKGPTQIRLHRAASLIAGGDVSEGAQYAIRTLEPLSADQRSDRLVGKIAEHALAAVPERARDTTAVAELREALTG
jgi:transcriptional regulator with XRE-family HTH domain